MFFKYFAGKKQLPGFYLSQTLVENGLKFPDHFFSETSLSSCFCRKPSITIFPDQTTFDRLQNKFIAIIKRNAIWNVCHFSCFFPADTGRKLNVHKTFRRLPGRLLNVLCTFNLRLCAYRVINDFNKTRKYCHILKLANATCLLDLNNSHKN